MGGAGAASTSSCGEDEMPGWTIPSEFMIQVLTIAAGVFVGGLLLIVVWEGLNLLEAIANAGHNNPLERYGSFAFLALVLLVVFATATIMVASYRNPGRSMAVPSKPTESEWMPCPDDARWECQQLAPDIRLERQKR
jgi:hypothetical protein